MRTRLLALTAALAMALTACSGGGTDDPADTGDAGDSAATAGAVTFVGTESLAWEDEDNQKSAALADGSLEVTIECSGAVPHNVVFEGVNDDAIIAECSGDGSGTGSVEVEAGTYTFYCSIPGHRDAGMEGEITVS